MYYPIITPFSNHITPYQTSIEPDSHVVESDVSCLTLLGFTPLAAQFGGTDRGTGAGAPLKTGHLPTTQSDGLFGQSVEMLEKVA
jgi:hypothetical protein